MSFDLELINGDLQINSSGDVSTVSGAAKLRQDIIKILVTELGSNIYQPWYGSRLDEGIIGVAQDDNFLIEEIEYAVGEALGNLQKLQRAQQTTQSVSASELIQSIQDILVQRSQVDPRNIYVLVKILSKALDTVDETFTL